MAVMIRYLLPLLLVGCFVWSCYGVTFSSLKKSLVVTASPTTGQVLKAGEDNITVTWSYNTTFPPGTDSDYKTVKLKLCYAPVSQLQRVWRKTEDELKKDKTCQHDIANKPYSPSTNTFTWTVQRDIPRATYFIRAYAYDSQGHETAYGETTNAAKSTNLFEVKAVTGRHVSLDIASVCFSLFSIVSLFGFFFLEKRKARMSQRR